MFNGGADRVIAAAVSARVVPRDERLAASRLRLIRICRV
jgi:hypothetical protein